MNVNPLGYINWDMWHFKHLLVPVVLPIGWSYNIFLDIKYARSICYNLLTKSKVHYNYHHLCNIFM